VHTLYIKPLSVNQAFRGRRFKTREYEDYEKELFYLLPNLEVPDGKLELNLVFGLSSKNADTDNPIKIFSDVCQKKYCFNDKMIYKIIVEKKIVKKGNEFIKFEFKKYGSDIQN